ncbi:MAG: VWA domain-containing protein [Thiotrichales bacterium]|nr:VWA domain-containing protein [Thiotrichales bacterium]
MIKVSLKSLDGQLTLTLQAIWGKRFSIAPIPNDVNLEQPYIEHQQIFLPKSYHANSLEHARNYYLSAALHCAGHIIYSKPWQSKTLNNRQMVLIGLFEDARVEYLSQKHFKGVFKIFGRQFLEFVQEDEGFNGIAYRLAYALRDPSYKSDHPLVQKASLAFHALSDDQLHDSNSSYQLGLQVANDIGQLRISMNERTAFNLFDYRDNNAFLWESTEHIMSEINEGGRSNESVGVTGVTFEESLCGKSVADDSQQSTVAHQMSLASVDKDSEHKLSSDSVNTSESAYPEWDYRIGRLKQNWCIVKETIHSKSNLEPLVPLVAYDRLIGQLQKKIQTYQFNRDKKRRRPQGVELDLEALVSFRVDSLMGYTPSESNVYIEEVHNAQNKFVLLVLLDLSESMNDCLPNTPTSLLEITSESLYVLSSLLNRLGHHYAVHGFSSDGRKDVKYRVFKEFMSPSVILDEQGLYDLKASYSTRLGAALRHADQKMQSRPEQHKLIMVISDGQPSDIDVFDEEYLIEDARVALREAEQNGCHAFCLSLDSTGQDYVGRIFKKGHYEVLGHPEKLPEILTKLYLKLFRVFL